MSQNDVIKSGQLPENYSDSSSTLTNADDTNEDVGTSNLSTDSLNSPVRKEDEIESNRGIQQQATLGLRKSLEDDALLCVESYLDPDIFVAMENENDGKGERTAKVMLKYDLVKINSFLTDVLKNFQHNERLQQLEAWVKNVLLKNKDFLEKLNTETKRNDANFKEKNTSPKIHKDRDKKAISNLSNIDIAVKHSNTNKKRKREGIRPRDTRIERPLWKEVVDDGSLKVELGVKDSRITSRKEKSYEINHTTGLYQTYIDSENLQAELTQNEIMKQRADCKLFTGHFSGHEYHNLSSDAKTKAWENVLQSSETYESVLNDMYNQDI